MTILLFLLFACNDVQVEKKQDVIVKDSLPSVYHISDKDYDKGKEIFKAYCRCCHSFKDDMIAPRMKYMNNEDYMFHYISNPDSLRKSGDIYSNDLKFKYPGNSMPQFNEVLSNEQIKCVIKFINYRVVNQL